MVSDLEHNHFIKYRYSSVYCTMLHVINDKFSVLYKIIIQFVFITLIGEIQC